MHDDLIQFGGAEKLLLAIHDIWPDAPVYTSVVSKKWRKVCKDLNITVKSSFMQHLPFIEKLNRFYSLLLFHVLAFESFDFSQYDVVLSISARYAHGIITKPHTKHICYMNSPGRMFWEPHNYFENEKIGSWAVQPILSHLRLWDYSAAQRVDHFIANSKTPQARIKKYYGRESTIIYPFVDTHKFKPVNTPNGNYYLIITRLLAWKHVEIAIRACIDLNISLKIVGEGPALSALKSIATANIEFLGYVSESQKLTLLQTCKAVINTQHEDFGIVPLEAMACGRPVVAYGKGGVLETVVPGTTGEFFYDQTSVALKKVLTGFNPAKYSSQTCRAQADRFTKTLFERNITLYLGNE